MNEWMIEHCITGMNEWMNKETNEWTKTQTNDRMHKVMNKGRTKEWMHQSTNGLMNEPMRSMTSVTILSL